MAELPRVRSPDSSLALLREGYEFIPNRCRRLGTDAFRTRVMLREVTCMSGVDAARFFYDRGAFTRSHGGIPRPTLRMLQDEKSVNVLDGDAHRHRKQLFLDLMSRESIGDLVRRTEEAWDAAAARWEHANEVVLFHAVEDVLCRAVCGWAGVPLPETEAERRARELGAIIDAAGGVGMRHARGSLARTRLELWIRRVVRGIRSGEIAVPEGSPAHVIAGHRGLDGEPLATDVAAIEIINLLRPTVAIARFVAFAAHALHEQPGRREALRDGDDAAVERFVQEVRRFYPFFPLVSGRAREELEWQGHRFPTGSWVMLDIYGTNRDGRAWERPDVFDPERFRDWSGDPFALIPQGGGDHAADHRCPGEWITIAVMTAAVRRLTRGMTYDVPPQDLTIDLGRMPAIPAGGVVISGVRRTA